MGKIFARTYATSLMGFHEIELYAIIRNKFTLPVSNELEQNWKRFSDDCLIFKIMFNKAKRVARCLKQDQRSYTIYYGNE